MMKPKADNNNDKMLKILREIVASGSNRNCFECGAKGVTYVNMTTGSFSCTTCSGILRGLTPPHRVKSISMAKFTSEELEFIRTHGNEECAKTWLGLWDSKRTIKQDHRDFMIDKYEKKRYYLEPASPLKSINTPSQQQPLTNGNTTKISHQQPDNSLAVLKSIQLTPPTAANRHHHSRTPHQQNGHVNGFASDTNNNNFFNQQNNLNGTSNGSLSHNGSIKSDNSSDFVADFSKASIYNSNNSLNSAGSGGGQVNGKTTNGGDMNVNFANFADFDNNKIYNAAEEYYKNNNNNNNNSLTNNTNNNVQWNIWQQFQWPNQPEQNRWSLPMTTTTTKSSLSNSLNSSGGTFNSNSSLNSTPSADRYAALKDLDEQLRDAKTVEAVAAPTEPAGVPVNPFKNPFQSTPQPLQPQQQQQQQSYQNWTIPESQSPFNGFGSPVNNNGFSNGFYYNHNMTNGIISQPSAFGGKGGFGNPFMTSGSASANNPFL